MADVQKRLSLAGIQVPEHDTDTFTPELSQAVRHFQSVEGLAETGVVDRATWSALIEASRCLGDRTLYLRQPMLRGQDVVDLQHLLGRLGFDAGRADGFFGEETAAALILFQQNTGLNDDGICGPFTVKMLTRVTTRSGQESIATLRERERLRQLPPTLEGKRIVVGETGGLGALTESLRRSLNKKKAISTVFHHPNVLLHAERANKVAADLYVGVELVSRAVCSAAYFSTERYTSQGGKRFAQLTVSLLADLVRAEDTRVEGIRMPILQKTKMPAIWLRIGPGPEVVPLTADIASAITQSVNLWVMQPL